VLSGDDRKGKATEPELGKEPTGVLRGKHLLFHLERLLPDASSRKESVGDGGRGEVV